MKIPGAAPAAFLMSFLVAGYPAVNLAAEQPESARTDALRAEAQSIVRTFMGSMKPLLLETVQSRGPAAAIDVCAVRAPEIAAQLSSDTGWEVTRVSSRPRNAAAASPDDWEHEVLERFESMLAAGDSTDPLHADTWQDGRYRYMQAQVVGAVCLLCHGEQVAPAVAEALAQRYPADRATGYRAGELRGAISLRGPAE